MASTNLTIRIEEELKHEANALFSDLGMNLSTAFMVFIRQAIRVQGLPFTVTRDTPNKETVAALQEADQIAKTDDVKAVKNMKSLLKSLRQ
ncbi:MAG: type II toxin-antitoxin system RelB/DinJ family antitoxin [Kiritimatiellia bacterium]